MTARAEDGIVKDSDVIGGWTKEEIEYFKNKEYIGDAKTYILFSLHYYPSYIKERLLKEDPYNSIAYKKDIITEVAMKQFASLRIENKQLLKRYFILLKYEIYARKGYAFKNVALKKFFEMMPWYSQSSGEVEINDKEKYNFERIEEREKLLEDIDFVNSKVVVEKNTTKEGNLKKEAKPVSTAIGGGRKAFEAEETLNIESAVTEEYTKKVIIEAEWGDGLGEFEVDLSSSPITTPGGLAVDSEGNVFVLDNANKRIQEFDGKGRLLNIFEVSSYGNIFGVIQGRIYSANVFKDTLEIISIVSREKVKVEMNIRNSKDFNKALPYGYVFNGELNIFQPLEEGVKKWKLQEIDRDIKIANFIEKPNEEVKLLNGDIKIKLINGTSFEIRKGTKPDIVDNKGNYYFKEKISSDKIVIIKTSSSGNLLSKINLPIKNYITDDCIPQNPIIDDYGNLYYLYCTGEIIVQDWEKEFIPGKVQVIKWELK